DRYSRRGNVPRSGKKVFSSTHAWRSVARESWGNSVSVLASVETVRDARAAMARGYAAAVVLPAFEPRRPYPRAGGTVVSTPHQARGVTCRECGLCRDDERLRSSGLVIAFLAHGTGAPAVRKTLISLPIV